MKSTPSRLFWHLDTLERISPEATKLFFYILHHGDVEISDRQMCAILGTATRTLRLVRQELRFRGLIAYESKTGRGGFTRYSLASTAATAPQPPPTPEQSSSPAPPPSTPTPPPSAVASALPISTTTLPLADILPYIHKYKQSWIEQFCMNRHLSPQQLDTLLLEFIKQLQCDGDTHRDIKDFLHYFSRTFTLKHNNTQNATTKLSQRTEQIQRRQSDTMARLVKLQSDFIQSRTADADSRSPAALPSLPDTDRVHSRVPSEHGEYPFK